MNGSLYKKKRQRNYMNPVLDFRKTISVFIAGILCVMIAGCGKSSEGGSANPASDLPSVAEKLPAGDSTRPEETKDAVEATNSGEEASTGEDGLPLVGVVTYGGGIEDASFNQSAWDGLQRLSGTGACETSFLETTNGDFAGNLDRLITQGGRLCWGIGYDCAETIRAKAAENPDRSFAVIDCSFDDTPDNLTGVVFRAEEPSFLVGYIAACTTKTGKIGFVGGEDNSVIHAFEYGFRAGVAYGGSVRSRTLTVDSLYAGSFTDAAKGKELAGQLYKDGCDIIYHAAGETGIGVIEAAKENDLYVIGVDKDQSYLAPENVLTSALKYVSTAVFRVSQDWLDGTSIGGTTISLGLAEDAVGISEVNNLYPDSVYEETMELKDKIISGEITPPADEEACKSFLSTLP